MVTDMTKRGEQFSLVPRNFQEALEFGRLMSSSDMVPKDYRGKPANVLVAVQMGADVGLSPMQALQSICVINGRPALWGDGMLAVVQGHPHFRGMAEEYRDVSETAVCIVRRAGRPDVERTFSRKDAEKAGLWGKPGPWQQYPRRMLQMRARSWALRDQFSDALRGIGSADEMADVVDSKTGQQAQRPERYVDAEVSGNGTQAANDVAVEAEVVEQRAQDKAAPVEAARKAPDPMAVIDAFFGLGIQRPELEEYLGAPLLSATHEQVDELRSVYQRLSRREADWHELLAERAAKNAHERHAEQEGDDHGK